jgi:hypothetical protein
MDSLAEELNCVWSLSPAAAALLTASSPRLQLDARVY